MGRDLRVQRGYPSTSITDSPNPQQQLPPPPSRSSKVHCHTDLGKARIQNSRPRSRGKKRKGGETAWPTRLLGHKNAFFNSTNVTIHYKNEDQAQQPPQPQQQHPPSPPSKKTKKAKQQTPQEHRQRPYDKRGGDNGKETPRRKPTSTVHQSP